MRTIVFILFIFCFGELSVAQLIGSELNYRKEVNGTMTIIYRSFVRCEGNYTVPSFSSKIYLKENDNIYYSLNPKLTLITSTLIFCNDSVSKCYNSYGTSYDILEIIHEVNINPSDTNKFPAFKNQCHFVVDYSGNIRSSNITTIAGGSNHYNYCSFNTCLMKINNHSPQYTFSLQDKCSDAMFFEIDNMDKNDDKYTIGFGHLYNSKNQKIKYIDTILNAYDFPVTAYFPGSLKPPYKNPNASPPLGVSLYGNQLIYTTTKPREVAVIVLEAYEKGKDSSGNIITIGTIRRDYIFNPDTNEYKYGYNFPPFFMPPTGYASYYFAGDSLSVGFNTYDVTHNSDTSIIDSVALVIKEPIPNATYRLVDSSQKNPILTFNWQTSETDFRTTPYLVKGIISDFNCPIIGTREFEFPIYIIPKPKVELELRDLGCGKFELELIYDSLSKLYFNHTGRAWQTSHYGIKYAPFPEYYKFSSTAKGFSMAHKDTIEFNINGNFDISYDIRGIGDYSHRITKSVAVNTAQIILPYNSELCKYENQTVIPSVYAPENKLDYLWFVDNQLFSTDSIFEYTYDFVKANYEFKLSAIVTDSNGCSDSETKIYELVGLNKLNLREEIKACKPETHLQLPDFKSYKWNTGETSSSLILKNPGTYWVEVQDFDSRCQNQTDTFTYILFPKIPTPHIRFDGKTIFSNSLGWHIWLKNDSVVKLGLENWITISGRGLYKCILSDTNGCISDTATIRLENTSSNLKKEVESKIHIYPNPAYSEATIKLSDTNVSSLIIQNLNGQLKEEIKLNGEYEIRITKYTAGVYFLIFTLQTGETVRRKLIFQ